LLLIPLSVQACAEDGDICNGTSYCVKGVGDGGSAGGATPQCHSAGDCDDQNPCTEDACEAGGSCANRTMDDHVVEARDCGATECSGGRLIDTLHDEGTPCGEESVCNGTGECKLILGVSCSNADDCASGSCADGVCCDRGCDFECESCSLPASSGTCTAVPMNEQDADTCAGAYVCDGEANCKLALGEACEADVHCVSGNCACANGGCSEKRCEP
jgi:hypothetical protein